MPKRKTLLAIGAIIAGIIGAGFFVLWWATLAWVSATPITPEHLASVRAWAWVALAGLAASLVTVVFAVISLIRVAR